MILEPGGLVQFQLSADEGSAWWKAEFCLPSRAAYAAVQLGDRVEFSWGEDTFNLVVDGKTLDRSFGAEDYKISAVSPLALLDTPFAAILPTLNYDAPALASAIVAEMLGAVEWNLPDWAVPAGSAAYANVSPFSVAKAVVESVGGLVESNPDGSVVCRLRHPVPVPGYASATPDHSLDDSRLVKASESLAPRAVFNRVRVTNGTAASEIQGDRLENQDGLVRAYPSPWRPVALVHSGGPQVSISPKGVVVRTEAETVEFTEGQGSTRYPVLAVASAVWQHADLGGVAASGKALTAETAGYSLLQLAYTVRAYQWAVADSLGESIQFILIED